MVVLMASGADVGDDNKLSRISIGLQLSSVIASNQ
jgi:hypothetical protein